MKVDSRSKPVTAINERKDITGDSTCQTLALLQHCYRQPLVSVLNRAFERRVNLRFQALAEQKRFHILNQKLLVFGINCAQTVMIDQLILRCDPGLPASLADLLMNLFAQGAAKRRFFQRWQLFAAS